MSPPHPLKRARYMDASHSQFNNVGGDQSTPRPVDRLGYYVPPACEELVNGSLTAFTVG